MIENHKLGCPLVTQKLEERYDSKVNMSVVNRWSVTRSLRTRFCYNEECCVVVTT